MSPTFSIIIPLYNGANYLACALQSIYQETIDHCQLVEVIVLDDGSTDASVSIATAFKESLPIRLIKQAHTGNWVSNTNRAMASAEGRYVCWLHQDDVWLPGRLKWMCDSVRTYPEAVWWFHPSVYIGPSGQDLGVWNCAAFPTDQYLTQEQVWERLLVQCTVASCASLFSATAARFVGPLDESLWYSADWDFWLRLSRLGASVYTPHFVTGYRLHTQSQTLTRSCHLTEYRSQQETVLGRYHREWLESHPDRADVIQRALVAVELNVALAQRYHGESIDWNRLLRNIGSLEPRSILRLLGDTRLWNRVLSRWRLLYKTHPEEPQCIRSSGGSPAVPSTTHSLTAR